jgi:hypothetical protein
MKDKLLRFPFTTAAAVVAAIVVLSALFGNFNLLDFPVSVLDRIEKHEINGVATALVQLIVAMVIDNVRAARREKRKSRRQAEQREAELQAEQLRVVHVTMRTVQDVMNNCLNQLQLLRVDAEGLVPEESLRFFDDAIHETSVQLKTLGNLDVFAEKPMVVGSGLDASVRASSRIVL